MADDSGLEQSRARHVRAMHASVVQSVIDGLRAEMERNGDDISVLDNPKDPRKPGLKQARRPAHIASAPCPTPHRHPPCARTCVALRPTNVAPPGP